MEDCFGLAVTIASSMAMIGVGMVIVGFMKKSDLLRLARAYPKRTFADAEEGTAVRVTGRVVRSREPRWQDPVGGDDVVLARLAVRNSAKVVVDIARGQAFEIENEAGERAAVEVHGATIEGPGQGVQLRWPPKEALDKFLTPRGHEILEGLTRKSDGPEGKVGGFATLTSVRAGDAIEVMGVARRDPSHPQTHGYRESTPQLVLGGVAEPPVVVVQQDLDVVLARNRDMRISGAILSVISFAALGLMALLYGWLGS